jgi:membrane-associated protein
LRIGGHQLVKSEYIQKTEIFFAKHGERAIILARFIPIIRTFAPFVAGIGTMKYKTFLLYNIIGGVIRISSLSLSGYFFGQQERVKHNFEKVILLIIFISILPILVHFLRSRNKKNAPKNSS